MWSKTSAYEHNSTWDFGSEVNVEKLPAVTDLLVAEIRRVLDGEIDSQDIDDAKSYALGRHQMGIQTVGQLSGWLAERYFFDGRIEDFATQPERIKAITAGRIIATAREFLAHNCWTLGLYGNTDKATAEMLHEKVAKLF